MFRPMELPLIPRIRAAVARPIARTVFETRWLRAWAAASRSEPVEGRTLDPRLAAMLRLDDMDNRSDLRRYTPARARLVVAEGIAVVQAPCMAPVLVEPVELAGPAGAVPARRYTPEGLPAPSPAVLYVHGGGFVTGDMDTHDPLCRLIASRAKLRVISVDYRLAPEHRFPAALDDAVAAFRDVVRRADALGVDATRIAVSGDSAGGNLSAALGMRTRADTVRPALLVPVYPALDATCSQPSFGTLGARYFLTREMCDWYYEHYLGSDPGARRDPEASPLLAADLAGLPPALVYTSGFDPLRDEGRAYADRLRAADVPVRHHCFDDLLHGFLLMTAVSESARSATFRVIDEMAQALRDGALPA